MPVPGEDRLALVTAVHPERVRLRVRHVASPTYSGRAACSVQHQLGLGWSVELVGPIRATARGAATADVVVLHGRVAGWTGRLLLRGRRATVLVPAPGQWPPRGAAGLVERLLARWADAVLLGPGTAPGRRGPWVPPFAVDGPEIEAAVLTRCHAFGAPSARLAEDVR